ncbi:hypothetical protein AA15973_1396 [Komagataeibacter sucrofermentans DSM 15973]|nr:hypothetical protein AA15973_1396 [Komagataeibacter sucrofermentans DSM 15973]
MLVPAALMPVRRTNIDLARPRGIDSPRTLPRWGEPVECRHGCATVRRRDHAEVRTVHKPHFRYGTRFRDRSTAIMIILSSPSRRGMA